MVVALMNFHTFGIRKRNGCYLVNVFSVMGFSVHMKSDNCLKLMESSVSGKGVANDLQKRSLLFHVAGVEVQEVYFTLVGEDTIAAFQDILKVLDDYFIPKANIPFERHLLRYIPQENSETVDQSVSFVSVRLAVTLENKRRTIFEIK